MEQVCLTSPESWGAIIAGIVTAFSVVANFVPKDTAIGKIVNWLALNLKSTKKTGT